VARAFALPEYLILDIETVPDVARWSRPEPVPGEEPRFPPTWAHRIVTIGYLRLDHGYRFQELNVLSAVGGDGDDEDDRERALLSELSLLVGERRPMIVTYNGRSFDLPVIALRALCHGVGMGWYYDDKDTRYRYSEHGHLDLCDWLADHGAVRAGKLDAITRLVGLPGKSGIDGSQVEGLYAAGRLDEIQRYCLADVAQTALLFLRFRLLQGKLAPDACRERLTELLAQLGRTGRVNGVLEGLDQKHLLGV
jgi:3'-5' exonuclease